MAGGVAEVFCSALLDLTPPTKNHMKNSLSIIHRRTVSAMLAAAALAAAGHSERASAGVTTWVGAGPDQNWSDSTNWTTVGGSTPPAAADSVVFNVTGAAAGQGVINNIVDTSFMVSGLTISNDTAATWHTTEIPTGNTLTVNGPVFVGGSTFLITNATFTGGGTLQAGTGTSTFTVATVGTGTATMCLDLSSLANFVCNPGGAGGAFAIGLVNPSSGNSGGTLNLAAVSNNITASTITVVDNNNGTCTGILNLGGGTNIINANTINIGWDKCNATVQFYTNTGSLMLRNAAGTGAANISMGDNAHSGSAGGNFSSHVNLTGHYVDMTIGTLELANRHARTGGGHTASFSFDTGVVNCSTVNMGINTAAAPAAAPGNGYLSVGGGTLNVGNISLVNSGSSNCVGSLTITNGGSVNCTGNIFKTTPWGTGSITNFGSTLSLASGSAVGVLTNPVDFMTLSNATLVLGGVTASTTNIFVANLDTENGGDSTVSNYFSIGLLPGISTFPAYFHLILYTNGVTGITDAGNNFAAIGISPAYTYYITNHTATIGGNTVGFVDLAVVSGPAAKTETWRGTPTANWNTSDLNWLSGGNPVNFNQGDFVTFDDTASGSTTVNLPGTLEPTTMTVNNTAKTYTFNGTGSVGGISTLVKQGSNSVLFDNSGSNTFSGTITLSAGTVQLGNNDANGNLGSGPLANNAALVVNRTDTLTMANAMTGNGGLTNIGTGTLVVAGSSPTYSGAVMAARGTLKLGASTALGTTNAGVLIANGAVLDFGGNELTNVPVTASGAGAGAGAIINSGGSIFPAITRLTLAGNITLGGTGRWDLRSLNVADSTGASLSTSGNAYNIIKTGTNTIGISGVAVDPMLGDIDIQQGLLTVESAITSLGNPANTLTVESGATLQLFNLTNQLNKVFVLNGNGTNATLINNSGANTILGPITLNGSNIISASSASLTLAGSIGGSGSLTQIGGQYLILSGNNTYSGATVVTNGTLAINGINGGTVSVTTMTNTTFVGTGTNTSPVTVSGRLSPGDMGTAGTLTVGGLTMSPGATATFDLNPSTTAGGGVNDLLQVNGALTLNNNTIIINMIQGTLAAGTYRLVNYTGTLTGSFNPTVALSIGGMTRYTLSLDTSTPGQINLVVGGSAARLVWDGIGDNTWDVGTTPNWFNPGTSAADNFYQGDSVLLDDTAGVQTTINLTNAVAPSAFTNNSSVNNFTISGPGKITGAENIVKMGSSTLMLASSNDFSGTVMVLAGTLQVGNNGALGATNGPTIISSGATLDLAGPAVANALNLGLEPIIVSGAGVGGAGAIINSSTVYQINATRLITLAGDTTFGGPGQFVIGNGNTPGRWDMRGAGTVLSTGGHAYNLTKVGNNQMSLVGVQVDPALGNIDIQGGMLGFEQSTTSMGNPAANMTIDPGAVLELYQGSGTNYFTKQFILNGDGASTNIDCANGVTVLNGTMTLNNGCAIYMTGGTTLSNNCVVKGTGSLTLAGAGTMVLTTNETYTGNTTILGGVLMLTGTGSIANSSNINLSGANSVLNLSGQTLTLGNGQNLTGIGLVAGNVTAGPNTTITPGNANGSTLTVNNTLTMNGGTNVVAVGTPSGNYFITTTNLTLTGVNTLVVSSQSAVGVGSTYPVIQYSGTLIGGLANLQAVGVGGFSFSVVDPATTPGTIQVTVTGVPANFLWRGGVAGAETNWDTVHANWFDPNLGNMTNFFSGVLAQFDDNSVYTNINLVGTLNPLSMEFQDFSTPYTFLGSGKITGSGGLTIDYYSTLIIANTGSNDFAGDVNVLGGGTLQIGNGGTGGNVGSGNINTTNGYLIYDRSDNVNIANAINGNSSLTNMGTGVLTLSGNNTLSGVYTVAQGTLKVNNNLALGGTKAQQGTLVVSPGATLDLGGPSFAAQGENLSNECVVVSGSGAGGAGAIINSSTNSQFNALRNVMVTGDVYVGGPGYWLATNASNPGRWDIRGSITNCAIVTSNMQPYSLYKIGSNHVGLVGVTIDSTPQQSLGNIYIQGGKLQIESGTTSLGDANSNLIVSAGATLGFYQSSFTNNFTKQFVFNGNGSTVVLTNESGTTTLNGAMDLEGGCILGIGGTVISNNCTVTGGGSLIMNGAGRLAMGTNVNYTGNTTISNGTLQFLTGSTIPASALFDIAGSNAVLDVSATTGTLNIGSGQTVRGGGTVRGNLAVSGSGTVAVGEPNIIGTLTVTNAVTLSGSGTTTMKVGHTSTTVNDVLKSGSTMALGGTLNLALVGTPVAGDTYTLFKATGGLSGTFSATNLPSLPGGLTWVTTNLVNGIVSVLGSVNSNPTNITAHVTGNVLTLTWPADHTGWRLLAQTNSTAGGLDPNTNDWFTVTGSTSVNTVNITMDPKQGTVFYRLVYP